MTSIPPLSYAESPPSPPPPQVLEFQAAHILHVHLTQKDKTWKRQRKSHSKIFQNILKHLKYLSSKIKH